MSCTKFFSTVTGKVILQNTLARSTVTAVRTKACITPELPEDHETHTGQKWDKHDYRMVRFVNNPKQVNPQFAINLIAKVPPKACKERIVWCDGGDDQTGHPRVYINLDKPGNHTCGYCGLRFFKSGGH